jgi:SsrA-binding protein
MAKDKTKAKVDGAEFLVCRNPKAQHDYEIEERLEAGLVLIGSEVKSLRARRADIDGAYAALTNGELFLHNAHIAPYEQAGAFGHEPKRVRKLLVHRQEITRMIGKLQQRGYTLIPLQVYFKAGRAKVELGLGKGRTTGDRRQQLRSDIAEKEAREAIGRARKQ